jgi:glutamine synthetase
MEEMLRHWSFTKDEVLEAIQRQGVKFVDLQLTDVPGKLHHITISTRYVDDNTFTEGVAKA